MDDVSKLINYAHSDWLRGEGRGLCQRMIPRNIVEHNIMLPYPNKGLKNNASCMYASGSGSASKQLFN